MREVIEICVGIAFGIWTASSLAMTITGQVVDSKARPVPGAEVIVCEQCRIRGFEQEAKIVSPVVKTDAQGRFTLEADVLTPREAFIVARKPGLAYAWEWLNYEIGMVSRKHILLVLEPACTLTGQIVDLEGRPVAGAEVQAIPVNVLAFGGRWPIHGPRQWLTATTDVQGRFRFEQFTADGSAGLWVQAPGGGSRYVFPSQEWKSYTFEVWRPDIRLVLPWEGTIKGRVVDSQGRPVGGVDLMIRSGREDEEITSRYIVRRTTSEQTGAFVFAGLPEGPHWINVLPPEFGPALWCGMETKVSVQAGQIAQATVRVDKGGVLEVTVLQARTRRPVIGVSLSAGGQRWKQCQSATTDTWGVARIRVPADSYKCAVVAGPLSQWQGTVQAIDGQTVRCEALLTIFPRVSGRVLDPKGRPAVDIVVTVHPFGDHVATDAEGRFELRYDERYGTKRRVVAASDPKSGLAALVPADPSFRPIDLTLGPAWTLVGRVTDPNGTGIPAARVSLRLLIDYCESGTGSEVLTDPAGRFEMKAIPRIPKDLSYQFSVNAAGYGPVEYLRIFPSGPAGTSIDLGTIRLPPVSVSISGVVVDARGMPAARVPVFVGDERTLDQPPKSTATNERGEFTFTRLCPGPVSFQAKYGNSPDATYLRTRLPVRDVKIVLGKGVIQEPEASVPGTASSALTDLCPGLYHFQTDGRPILLCLVDVHQPSSRQCLADLIKKADFLEAKGVITVVAQTSLAGTRQEYDLLNAHCGTFPWRAAWEGFEGRKATWGIKSLPWLILTDHKHAVIAQGFPLDQLEDRIKGIDHAKP